MRSQTVKAGTGEVLADYVWEYNPAGEIVKEAPWHLGAVFEDGRDARGRLTFQATPGNNGGSTPPPFENTIVGMPEGNQADPSLEAQGTPKKVLPVPARIAGYTLDPLGNRTFMQVDGVGTTLTYDAASRLISEISANGKSVTHEYDDWGQEIRKIASQDGFATATEAYGYDYLGRMSAYTNSSTGAAWQYDYWPNGDRYAKTNLSTQWKELYVPILGQVVADYTQTGSDEIQHQASYAQGEGSKAARISSGGTRAHYVLGLGGSFDLTLGDEGAVLAEAVHDSFGVSMGGDSVGPYGYAQMRSDSESGLWTYPDGTTYDADTNRILQDSTREARASEARSMRARANEIAGNWLHFYSDEGMTEWAYYEARALELEGRSEQFHRMTGDPLVRMTLAGTEAMAPMINMGYAIGTSPVTVPLAYGANLREATAAALRGDVQAAKQHSWALAMAAGELALLAVPELIEGAAGAWQARRAAKEAARASWAEMRTAYAAARAERAAVQAHYAAHAAARAELRAAAQAERYVSPGMFRGEAARLQAESAARHGFTDATKNMVGMRGAAETEIRATSAWTRTDISGTRVYQRSDLISPHLTDKLGRTNVQRMKAGLAPVGPDGKPINLHHMLQTADSPLAEMTQTFHQKYSRIIHINPNTVPSGINRAQFDAWRSNYWMNRANDF